MTGRQSSVVEATAPGEASVTEYDRAHAATYARLLDAERAGADWREVARLVLGLDPAADEVIARRCHESHLARAHWMTHTGYRQLLLRSD